MLINLKNKPNKIGREKKKRQQTNNNIQNKMNANNVKQVKCFLLACHGAAHQVGLSIICAFLSYRSANVDV